MTLRTILRGAGYWLTREIQCILEHSYTERQYCLRVSPSHPAPIVDHSRVPHHTWNRLQVLRPIRHF